MKLFRQPIIILVVVVLLFAGLVSGCGKDNDSTDEKDLKATSANQTEKATEKPTEKPTGKPTSAPTEKPTQKPTEKPTDPPLREYTAVELASKNLDEIIAIMDNDYHSEELQLTYAFSSDSIPYIYNYEKLPGFGFASKDNDYYGISIMDGAKLNNSISSDMTYNQLSEIIGDMDGTLANQGDVSLFINTTIDGYSVTFCFYQNDYTIKADHTNGTLTSDVLHAGNPKLHSIGLKKEPQVISYEIEEPTEISIQGYNYNEVQEMLTNHFAQTDEYCYCFATDECKSESSETQYKYFIRSSGGKVANVLVGVAYVTVDSGHVVFEPSGLDPVEFELY